MTRRSANALLALFGTIALTGIAVAVLGLIAADRAAEREQDAHTRQIEVLGALTCASARAARADARTLRAELDAEGFIAIAPPCREFVELLSEDLRYTGERVVDHGRSHSPQGALPFRPERAHIPLSSLV